MAMKIRDVVAAVLLLLGLLLPWNIYFGLGIAGTTGWFYALLLLATVAALAAVALGRARPEFPDRLRLALTIPYLVVVALFIVFAVVQSVRDGGSATVPPGVGPGAWLGLAGALLAAQFKEFRAGSIIAVVALVLGVAATVLNLYWRTRFVLPHIGDPDVGTPNLATAILAVLYALVAVIPLVLTFGWLRSDAVESRWATVLLGASVLIAGLAVWGLPVGRDLDAFHGIAQNTGTAGVGFESYLAWVAVAAIVGTATVSGLRRVESAGALRGAIRKSLLLIGAWCAGTAVLRISDVAVSAVLDLPAPPYNGTALMAFDLVVAVLALWLFVNTATAGASGRVIELLLVALFAFSVGRVIVGVALVPRVPPLNPSAINDVFGNDLAQQITSTFDVALCVLALAVLGISAWLARAPRPQPQSQPKPAVKRPAPVAEPVAAPSAPRIVRTERPKESKRIADSLAQSTQRFAAQSEDSD